MKIKDDIFSSILKTNKYARIANGGLITDIKWHIDTGNYMLNALFSGSIYNGLPGNKIVGFAGQPSSGKSYLTLHIIKNFLKMNDNYKAIFIDTEGALTTTQLNIVDIDMDRFMHEPIKDLGVVKNELAQTMANISKKLESDKDFTSDNKYLFVIDSLAMPPMTAEIDNALKNDTKEDMGKRNKLIKSIFRICTMDLAYFQYPMIVTTHTYDSMQQYQPRGVSGGKAMIFAGTYLVELSVAKDKDNDGDISGVIVTATLRKSRESRQFAYCKVKIDFRSGLDRYYGLLDFALRSKVLIKDGKKILFPDGNRFSKSEIEDNPIKFFNKEILDLIDEECKKYFLYGVDLEEEDVSIIDQFENEN